MSMLTWEENVHTVHQHGWNSKWIATGEERVGGAEDVASVTCIN